MTALVMVEVDGGLKTASLTSTGVPDRSARGHELSHKHSSFDARSIRGNPVFIGFCELAFAVT
jgi:hypothetical protein